jgi:ADP-ribosyltransferase exoenzyme
MSRIPSGNFEPVSQIQGVVDGGTPGRPIGGEPTIFGNIPVPVPIIPFGPTVDELPPHHQAEPLPLVTTGNPTIGPTRSITTTTTTTTTTAPRLQMVRGLSAHRIRGRLANSEKTAPLLRRSRSPSPMGRSAPFLRESGNGSESHSGDEIPGPMPPVFRKVTLNKERSASRLKKQPSEHRLPRLAKTGESPRPERAEYSPPRMVNSAPDAPATVRAPDLPEGWRKAWRKQVDAIKEEEWCKRALQMVGKDREPNLELLGTLPPMREAYRRKVSAPEAVSIFLYTSALYKKINGPLQEDRVKKLPSDERKAVLTMIKGLDGGLSKLPWVNDRLVRVVNLDEDFGNSLQPGARWKQKSYGSCFREVDRKMSWEGNYELYFRTSGAHDVSAFSDAANEREILVERDRRYRIVSRDETSKPVKLELEEIRSTKKHKKH